VLTYYFDKMDYHGAAHGTCGILYLLLQFPSRCQDPAHLPWITATVDAIINSQYPSGNFSRTFIEDEAVDMLVHWCHGAPGVVYTLYHAHKLLGSDKRILRSLDRALQLVWERGILKKGVGLCHGVSGSGYTFLMMYRYTGAEEHLYRAYRMAEAMRSDEVKQAFLGFHDPQRYSVGIPDFPYSLMEGVGGALCFCCDLLHPESAAFPGYGDIV
jgi:lantibiotic modifying enzyme